MGRSNEGEEEDSDHSVSKMRLYLQVRAKTLNHHEDAYLHGYVEEHKWFAITGDNNFIDEIHGNMSRIFSRDAFSSYLDDSTVFVCGGKLQFSVCGGGGRGDNLISSNHVWYADTYINNNGVDDSDYDNEVVYTASGWIKGPSMLLPRSGACAVTVDGRIYVFGGVRCPNPNNWAEVFDTRTNKWFVLKAPVNMNSLYVSKCVLVVMDEMDSDTTTDDLIDSDFSLYMNSDMGGHWANSNSNSYIKSDKYFYVSFGSGEYLHRDIHGSTYHKKGEKKMERFILVCTPCGHLWSYDLYGTWELFDSEFGSWAADCELVATSTRSNITTSASTTTISTHLLLTISKGLLRGYHVGQKEWYKDPVSGLENVLPSSDFTDQIHLVSMGRGSNRKLCVLWSKYSTDLKALRVYCTIFKVYEDGQSTLAAKVESTNVFNLDCCDALISCQATDTRSRKIGGAENFIGTDTRSRKRGGECPNITEAEAEADADAGAGAGADAGADDDDDWVNV